MYRKTALLILITVLKTNLWGQPTGIYVLDNSQGTYRDANIRNYSFIDGFVWRTSWSDFETAQGVFDFQSIDHIVHKLDSINKKLTILFGSSSIEPSYIAMHNGVTTYQFTDPISNLTSTRAVPYDSFLLAQFRTFLLAFSSHQIYSISSGTMVELKNHPVIANIATNVPGLGAIRNVNGQNTSLQNSLPGYSRNKFVDSIITSLKIQTDYFPTKNVFIPFYKNTSDNTTSPSLDVYIRNKLLQNFNGTTNPKLSFWQENLAGYTDTSNNVFTGLPLSTFATPLYQLNDSAYTMFQMLQGWTTPFLDPSKTANSSPFDAMCYAYNTYNTSYYEIYVSDIDNSLYQQDFNNWNAANCQLTLNTLENKSNLLPIIFPNPATNSISMKNVSNENPMKIIIVNAWGQNCIETESTQNINISNLPKGLYDVLVRTSKKTINLKLIKH